MPWLQYFHDRLSAIEKHVFGPEAATQIAEQSPDFGALSEAEVAGPVPDVTGTGPGGQGDPQIQALADENPQGPLGSTIGEAPTV